MKTKLFIIAVGSVALCLFGASAVFSQNQSLIFSLVDDWAKSVAELKISMDKLSDQNELVSLENKQLAQEIKDLLAQTKNISLQIEDFDSKDVVVLQSMGKKQDEVSRLEQVLKDLAENKIDSEEKISKLRKDIKKKNKKNEQIGLEINQIKENMRFLKEKRKSGQKEYKEFSSQYTVQEARLVQLLEMSKADRKDWNEKTLNLNQEILSFRQRFQKLNRENKKIYSEMLGIYEDVLTLSFKQDSLNSEHAVALEQYQKESGMFSSEIAQIENQKQELENSLAVIEAGNQELKQNVGTEKVEMLRSEASRFEGENKDLQIELKKLKKDLSRAQKQKQKIESLIKN